MSEYENMRYEEMMEDKLLRLSNELDEYKKTLKEILSWVKGGPGVDKAKVLLKGGK